MIKVKLSILIPVYNEERTLAKIVEKVQQVHIPDVEKELIIINDASTDNTSKILEDLRLKYSNVKSFHHHKTRRCSISRLFWLYLQMP